jgi:hypothetical protein
VRARAVTVGVVTVMLAAVLGACGREARPGEAPRAGDLLFYASGGTVHHVSMALG